MWFTTTNLRTKTLYEIVSFAWFKQSSELKRQREKKESVEIYFSMGGLQFLY